MFVHSSFPKQYTEFIFGFQKPVQTLLSMKFYSKFSPSRPHPVDLKKKKVANIRHCNGSMITI